MDSENMPTEIRPGPLPLRYTDEQLALIHRFLAVCLTNAEMGLERCTPEDKSLLGHPLIKNQMAYWRNVASAAKWFASLACRRQLHLGIDDDAIINEQVAQWTKQSQS